MEPFCSKKKIITKDGREVPVCDDTRSNLIDALQEVQRRERYISDENMQLIADRFGIHPVEVYSVISFYSFLSTEPKGRNVIRISGCVTSTMKGSASLTEAFEKALGIKCGQTTDDGRCTLEMTSCIGMCDKAPAIMVNDDLVGPVRPEDVPGIIEELN